MTPSSRPRSVLVTGAGRGIGLAITQRLAADGWSVYAGARSAEHLASLGRLDGVRPVRLDITDAADVAALDDVLPARLDAVVNNAGRLSYGPVEAVAPAEWRDLLELNVTSQVAVTQAVLPRLRAATGRIVFVSSVSGLVSTPWSGAYNASKFALEGMADALRVELRPWGVRVVLVEPGTTDTDMWARSEQTFDAVTAAMSAQHSRLYARQAARFRRLLAQVRRSAVPPDRVARTVARALTAARPRARYRCDVGSRVQILLDRSAPTAVSDAVVARVTGAYGRPPAPLEAGADG